MKEEMRNVLDFEVPMLVYESVAEADKAAGKEGAALKECNNNLLYRGTFNDARWLIDDIVFKLTKVPYKMVQVTKDGKPAFDDKKQPIMEREEKESTYIKRALAATPAVTKEMVQAEVIKLARGYSYTDPSGKKIEVPALAADITQRERAERGPIKLPNKFKEAARMFLAAPKRLKNFLDAAAKANIGSWTPLPDKPQDDPANVEALGWLCKKWSDAQDVFKSL